MSTARSWPGSRRWCSTASPRTPTSVPTGTAPSFPTASSSSSSAAVVATTSFSCPWITRRRRGPRRGSTGSPPGRREKWTTGITPSSTPRRSRGCATSACRGRSLSIRSAGRSPTGCISSRRAAVATTGPPGVGGVDAPPALPGAFPVPWSLAEQRERDSYCTLPTRNDRKKWKRSGPSGGRASGLALPILIFPEDSGRLLPGFSTLPNAMLLVILVE
mmetsp:Transcript_14255/g.42670  ORF Transcript_14255/g.42670 Transcript_14255/m.42670 type:complete len:218 (+) Transcript_14255:908-1561(+)